MGAEQKLLGPAPSAWVEVGGMDFLRMRSVDLTACQSSLTRPKLVLNRRNYADTCTALPLPWLG